MTEKVNMSCSAPTEEELKLINTYTRRAFTAEEVYVFSLTLCDNDVDRDFERFTVESLFELEKLFVGKTGIIDHKNSSKNQTARIYKCEVQAVQGKKTATGDDYFKLTAKAYIPVTEGNKETILAIDSGIKKEVSVGCAVADSVCSVCGEKIGSVGCNHTKGASYNGKLCYAELMNPYDAYEWSFVAVPAQREAGVTKSFKKDKGRNMKTMDDIKKILDTKADVSLSAEECAKLGAYVKELEKNAYYGREYRLSLEKEFAGLMAIAEPELSEETVKSAVKAMEINALKEFIKVYRKKADRVLPMKSQFALNKKDRATGSENKEFRI